MYPAGENYLTVIKKFTDEFDAIGIKSFESPARKYLLKPIKIKHPLDIAPLIEHTLLKPAATHRDIIRLCDEAKQFNFRGVCVNPSFVNEAQQQLAGSKCLVISVVGFPLGANLTITKVEETKHVIKQGANEIDMVIPIGALKDGDYKTVYHDIRSVTEVAGAIPVKVIIETGLLIDTEKIAACLLSMRAGAAFIKTSTGINTRGATVEDVKLLRAVSCDKIGIKAAGGIRDFHSALALLEAGANILGCSASVAIVTERLQNKLINT